VATTQDLLNSPGHPETLANNPQRMRRWLNDFNLPGEFQSQRNRVVHPVTFAFSKSTVTVETLLMGETR